MTYTNPQVFMHDVKVFIFTFVSTSVVCKTLASHTDVELSAGERVSQQNAFTDQTMYISLFLFLASVCLYLALCV